MPDRTEFILVINPGSTSTKLAIFAASQSDENPQLVQESTIRYEEGELPAGSTVIEQLESRTESVRGIVQSFPQREQIKLIMARGGPLHPIAGGVYAVNNAMLEDLRSCKYADHASNLAALIGEELKSELNSELYIADPVTVDEFEPLARLSGLPEIERKCRSHALNIKATGRMAARQLGIRFEDSRFVVAHMGGGISIAALNGGRIIDVNDALLGMGPFGPERAGALPLAGMLDLFEQYDGDRKELESLLSRKSGLRAYLGTADLQEVEKRISLGDAEAKLVFDAMVYQIAKEVAAMATVHRLHLHAIVFTGGMAQSELLISELENRLNSLAPFLHFPGEHEMLALAQAGSRVLLGHEQILTYTP